MTKLLSEKVIDALGRCSIVPDRGYNACENCPYTDTPIDNQYASCRREMLKDARQLICQLTEHKERK